MKTLLTALTLILSGSVAFAGSTPAQQQPVAQKPVPVQQAKPKPAPVQQAKPKPAPVQQAKPKPAPPVQQAKPKPAPVQQAKPKPAPVQQAKPKPAVQQSASSRIARNVSRAEFLRQARANREARRARRSANR